MKPFLNDIEIQFYQDNGYLIIKDFMNFEDIEILKKGTEEIIKNFNPHELKIFTTENQQNHLDTYFLESGDKVCCFFEEEAISKNGDMLVAKELAINKVGHAMHDLIPAFEKITYSKQLLSISKCLGLRNPSIVQSQYIFKQPKIGAKVNPHTDSTFIYTEPHSCVGAWIALEDATIENGCLTAITGSHKLPLKERFICNKERTSTKFVSLDTKNINWELQKMKALEVEKGDMILLHGQLVHASYVNRSTRSRHAFVLHMIDLDCKWPANNWLQRSDKLPFRSMESVVNQRFG
jgi:phytanoyl-CoA hydroxylase